MEKPPADSDVTEGKGFRAGGDREQRTKVRVEAYYKGKRYLGEGYNVRTAKLKIAQQLGVDF